MIKKVKTSWTKLDWAAAAFLFALFSAVLTWCISIEVRIAKLSNMQDLQSEIVDIRKEMHSDCQKITSEMMNYGSEVRNFTRRIQNLEELLVPILIDFKVRQELEKTSMLEIQLPDPNQEPAMPGSAPPPAPEKSPIEKRATDWATQQIKRGQSTN